MTKWEEIHFILNHKGLVVGDYERSQEPYGFLRNGVSVSVDEALPKEREIFSSLLYLFYTLDETQVHEQYEYVELEEYTMYQKIHKKSLYHEMSYVKDPLERGHYIHITYDDGMLEYYILTVIDRGLAKTIVNHFRDDYGLTLNTEHVEASDEEDREYWDENVTFFPG